MCITLNKEDTLKLFVYRNRLQSLNSLHGRYKTRTLHKWWCLNCGKEIFVNYDAISLQNIFCNSPDCKHKYKKPNIVQFQYLKKLKEYQLKLFNNIK